jgi:hypothetical protein
LIPEFDDHGYLPPGVHIATLDEVDHRFGQQSELRRVQMQSLRWLVESAGRAGVRRIVINGSFVTDLLEPNDVDCVLMVGSDYPLDEAAEKEFEEGIPFLELQFVDDRGFTYFVERFYATDRDGINKGMIEIRP